ncbi:MAG: hypothetical protein WA113_07765 [Desulfitobacteriaceae bacterium]
MPIEGSLAQNGIRPYDAAHGLFGLAQYPVIDVLYRKNFELIDQ